MANRRYEALTPGAARAVFTKAGRTALGWWVASGGGLALPVLLRLGPTPQGEVVCTAVALGVDTPRTESTHAAVTATALRIPLAAIVSDITGKLERGASVRHFKGGVAVEADSIGQVLGYLADHAPTALHARPGRPGHSHEQLRSVVAEFKRALHDNPHAPTKTAAARLGRSESQVRYLLRAARRQLDMTVPSGHAPAGALGYSTAAGLSKRGRTQQARGTRDRKGGR